MKNNLSLCDDTAFVISSCDTCRDLWEPYFTFFFRYWPDCPFPIYLISNSIKYDRARVNPVLVGKDKGWATNMRSALQRIELPYIILTMEDFFLNKPVRTGRIMRLLAYMKKREAVYLRLYPCPGPDTTCPDNPEVGEIRRGTPYRTSLQVAIWKRDTMLQLLKDGENPWQMEINGSARSCDLTEPFLSAIRDEKTEEIIDPPISYLCTAVAKGKWDRRTPGFCYNEGVRIELKRRPVEGTMRGDIHDFKKRVLKIFLK